MTALQSPLFRLMMLCFVSFKELQHLLQIITLPELRLQVIPGFEENRYWKCSGFIPIMTESILFCLYFLVWHENLSPCLPQPPGSLIRWMAQFLLVTLIIHTETLCRADAIWEQSAEVYRRFTVLLPPVILLINSFNRNHLTQEYPFSKRSLLPHQNPVTLRQR